MPQSKEYYHDVDLKANQLFNSRLHNITTAARTALGLGLTTNDKGYMVYDTNLSSPYFWDGVQWNAAGGGGGTWGSITGTITAQTDLITYLSTNYYPVTNPAGYITSSALSPYLTSATAASTYVPLSRNITINGTTYDLSADRTWTVSGLPSQATHAGEWLTTNGTTASWAALPTPLIPNLQQVTDIGNIVTDISNTAQSQLLFDRYDIYDTTGSAIGMNVNNGSGSNANFYVSDGGGLSYYTSTGIGRGLFNIFFPGLTADRYFTLSVNGNYADNTGAITIPVGTGTVTGTGTATRVAFWDGTSSLNSNANLYWDNTNSYLGIGTASPAYPLDVNGNQNISGYLNFKSSAAPTSIRIGSNDIENGGVSPNKDRLVLIGANVATALTTKITNQSDSLIAIGYGAAYTTTSGGLYSVYIGRNAGGGITTGEFNTHIGSGDATNIPSGTGYSIHINAGGGYEFNNGTRLLNGLTSKYAFIGGGYNSAGYINDFYLGAGPFVTEPQLANLSIYAPSSTTDNTVGGTWNGTNAPGSNFTINSGRGTGTGTPGDFIIKTATKTTSGNTQQTLAERVKVAGDNGEVTISNLATGGADKMVTVDTNGKLKIQTIPSGGGGTVTSVDLSMPSAFTVSNNPVTTSGTLTVIGAGTSAQYVKGDGSLGTTITKTSELTNDGDNGYTHFISLQDLPSNLTLYATNVASGINTYTKAVSSLTDPDFNTVAVNIPVGPLTSTTVATYCGGIVSAANIINGNPGIFTMSTIGNIRRTGGTAEGVFFYEVYKRDSGGTETLITTSANTYPVSSAVYVEFNAAALFNNGVFTATDRIVIKFYGLRLTGGSNPSFEFQFGGIAPVRTTLPIPLAVTPLPREILSIFTATAAGSTYGIDYIYLVSGTTTLTLPTAVGSISKYTIKRVGTGVVSVATTSSQTIDGSSSPININVQYVSIDLISDGANWNII